VFQEWVPGGSLTSLLEKFGSFPTPVIQSYLFQILSGLQYLHEKNVLHRDIKGGNILVNDEGIVKLADFGASKSFVTDSNGILMEGEDSMANMTIRGTPYFMAPEVFQESYGRKADVWSCACVVYQMCTAHVPWRSLGIKSPVKLFMHIQNSVGLPPFSDDGSDNGLDIHESLLDLMKQCFERDPIQRPSVQSLLEHDFFLEHDSCEHSEVGSMLGDDSLPGASVIAGRPSFSPMQLAKLKRGRVDAEVDHDKKHRDTPEKVQQDQSGWPSWAKNYKDNEGTNSECANPFAS
jgi:mitogen-activated protein kinase kinase kinase 3